MLSTDVRKEYFLVLLLIIISLIPRLGMLFSTSDYFLHEQGELYLITKGIVIDHNFPLISPEVGGVGNFAKGPLFSYFFVLPFILFHGDPFGGRVMMFAIGLCTVALMYITTRKIFDQKTAYIATFLCGISPFLVTFSGNIFAPYVIPLLTIIFLFSIYNILKKKPKYFLLAAASLGLMMHFEIVSAITLGISFGVITLIHLTKKNLSVKTFLLTIFFFILPLGSVFLYDIMHHFENMRGVLELLTYSSKKASIIKSFTFKELFINRIDTFTWSFLGTFTPQKILAFMTFLFIYIIGVFYIQDKKNKDFKRQFILLLLIQPFITFSFFLFYKSNIFSWWITELSIIYIFLFSILSIYAWKKSYMKYFLSILYILLFLAFVSRTITLFKTSVRLLNNSYVKQLVPLTYIFNDSESHNIYIEEHTTRPSTKDYAYLAWWLDHAMFSKERREPTYSYVITESGFPTFQKLISESQSNNQIKVFGKDFIVEKVIRQ